MHPATSLKVKETAFQFESASPKNAAPILPSIVGQRKLVWRSTMEDAKESANDVFEKITEGQAGVLNKKSRYRPPLGG